MKREKCHRGYVSASVDLPKVGEDWVARHPYHGFVREVTIEKVDVVPSTKFEDRLMGAVHVVGQRSSTVRIDIFLRDYVRQS